MGPYVIGADYRKWLIVKDKSTSHWHVLPPVIGGHLWMAKKFSSGAEAFKHCRGIK